MFISSTGCATACALIPFALLRSDDDDEDDDDQDLFAVAAELNRILLLDDNTFVIIVCDANAVDIFVYFFQFRSFYYRFEIRVDVLFYFVSIKARIIIALCSWLIFYISFCFKLGTVERVKCTEKV